MSRVNEKDIDYPYYKCELTDEEALTVGVNLHKLLIFIGEKLEPKKNDPYKNAIYCIRKRINHDYKRISKKQIYNLMISHNDIIRNTEYIKIPYISDKLFNAIFAMYARALKSSINLPEEIKEWNDLNTTRGRVFYYEQVNSFVRSMPLLNNLSAKQAVLFRIYKVI